MGDVIPFVPLGGSVRKWHVTLQREKRYKAMIVSRVDPKTALRDCMKEMKCKKLGMYDYVEVMEEYEKGKYRLAYDPKRNAWTKAYGGEAPDAEMDVANTKPPSTGTSVAKLVAPPKPQVFRSYPTDLEDSKERMSYKVVKDA